MMYDNYMKVKTPRKLGTVGTVRVELIVIESIYDQNNRNIKLYANHRIGLFAYYKVKEF